LAYENAYEKKIKKYLQKYVGCDNLLRLVKAMLSSIRSGPLPGICLAARTLTVKGGVCYGFDSNP